MIVALHHQHDVLAHHEVRILVLIGVVTQQVTPSGRLQNTPPPYFPEIIAKRREPTG